MRVSPAWQFTFLLSDPTFPGKPCSTPAIMEAAQVPALETGSSMAAHDNEINLSRLSHHEDLLRWDTQCDFGVRLDPR
jgi:hypothetical protein